MTKSIVEMPSIIQVKNPFFQNVETSYQCFINNGLLSWTFDVFTTHF